MPGLYKYPDVNISKYNKTIITGDTSDRPQGLACKLKYSLMYLHQNLTRQPSEYLFLGTPPWEGDYLASKVDWWVKVCNTINTSPSSLKLRIALISRIIYYWKWECCLRWHWWWRRIWFIPEKVAMFILGNFLVHKLKVMHSS